MGVANDTPAPAACKAAPQYRPSDSGKPAYKSAVPSSPSQRHRGRRGRRRRLGTASAQAAAVAVFSQPSTPSMPWPQPRAMAPRPAQNPATLTSSSPSLPRRSPRCRAKVDQVNVPPRVKPHAASTQPWLLLLAVFLLTSSLFALHSYHMECCACVHQARTATYGNLSIFPKSNSRLSAEKQQFRLPRGAFCAHKARHRGEIRRAI